MRKYEKGELITSMDEFAKEKLIWDSRVNRVYHNGWCQSWQFRYVKTWINRGVFYKVKLKKEVNKMSAFAEYKYAKTEAEREEAMMGIRAEVEKDRYFDEYEHDCYEDEDEDFE